MSTDDISEYLDEDITIEDGQSSDNGKQFKVTDKEFKSYLSDVGVAETQDLTREFDVSASTVRRRLKQIRGVEYKTVGNRSVWYVPSSSGSGFMPSLGAPTIRPKLRQISLLVIGGSLAGVAWQVSGWLVGMFGRTLSLPAGTRFLVASLGFVILLYLVAIEEQQGKTFIDRIFGGLE